MATLVNYALTSLADVKESLGIASSDTSKDNLIIRKINAATDLIQNYCQRQFRLQQYTQYYDGSGDDEIVLKQRPIVVNTARNYAFLAEIRDTSLNDDNFETIDSQLYFIDNSSGVLELNYNATGRWNRYRYTYYAGYAFDAADINAGIAGVPNDLAEAANQIACFLVKNPTGQTNVQLQREGGREIRYFQSPTNFAGLIGELGIDSVINAYANDPLATDV